MSSRDDRVDAALWAVVGVLILVASLRMDRLENLGINPWSIPGLTPAVVGALMVLLALALAWRARSGPSSAAAPDEARAEAMPSAQDDEPGSLWSVLVAGLLCIAFAGISLGHGLPFALEAAIFVFVFTTVFSWSDWRARGRVTAGLVSTAVIAVAAAGAIAWLFESVFLVRLP